VCTSVCLCVCVCVNVCVCVCLYDLEKYSARTLLAAASGLCDADPSMRYLDPTRGVFQARSVSSRIRLCMSQCKYTHARARELARVALQPIGVT
jgi:hypothetical protein